jgi:hypothetical protein
MPKFHYSAPAAACVALVTIAACSGERQDEMSWAQAALERNANIEVVGADQQNRTLTVKLKDTGALRTVRLDQLIASPPQTVATESAQPQTPTQSAATAPAAAPATATGEPVAATEAASATASGAAPPAQPSSLLPQNAAAVEAAPGRVLESGPGYTIKTAGPESGAAGARAREGAVTSAPLERRREPIVCQGARLLHIDNRNLLFDGDAVNAEDGCEIYITNSHLRAGGVGVLARAANVHIDNSLIEGEQGSIDASEGAQVYVASSQFKGLRRRLDNASFHDLGGNVWN